MDLKILSTELELDSTIDRLCGDEALLLELLNMLVIDFNKEESDLHAHLQVEDYESLASKAHHYKGIGSNLGLMHLTNASINLEDAARAADQSRCEKEMVSMTETIARVQALVAKINNG